jgi:hypothetical protein
LFTQPWITVPDPLASAIPAVVSPAVSTTTAPMVASRLIVKLPPTAPAELSILRMTAPAVSVTCGDDPQRCEPTQSSPSWPAKKVSSAVGVIRRVAPGMPALHSSAGFARTY